MRNQLTAVNLHTKEEITFSHCDPVMAMSYLAAKHTNELTNWSGMTEKQKRDHAESIIVRGRHHWIYADSWFIRYPKPNDAMSMYLSEQDPRVPIGSAGYCPCCLGNSSSGAEVKIEGKNAFQDIYCPECEFEWREVYSLCDATALINEDEGDETEE